MHPSLAGGMALLTNRQITMATVIMPEACANIGMDTSHISRVAEYERAHVKNTQITPHVYHI